VSALLELGAGFHPELSGRDNIFLNASILGMPRSRVAERFDDIVRFAELEQSIDVAVKHYSSGMQARLGFAVAVHVDPDVLLIDEVLSVGDESFQERCLEAIYRFRRAGKTILLVSHDLTSIRNLCTEVIWIDRGRMRARGVPGAVVSDYFAASHTHSETGVLDDSALDDSDRRSADDAGRRWGSHEAEIVGVHFESPTGDSSGRAQTGDAVTIRVHYRAHERIENPVFGLALTAANGTLISGPNTAFSGFDIPSIRGEGTISYTIRRLDLLPGEYWLSASLYDASCAHAYDYHDRLYPLVVVPSASPERYGLVHLHACWGHQTADARGAGEPW
jgi:lipopolysaccharide transport system ATP-binding protein